MWNDTQPTIITFMYSFVVVLASIIYGASHQPVVMRHIFEVNFNLAQISLDCSHRQQSVDKQSAMKLAVLSLLAVKTLWTASSASVPPVATHPRLQCAVEGRYIADSSDSAAASTKYPDAVQSAPSCQGVATLPCDPGYYCTYVVCLMRLSLDLVLTQRNRSGGQRFPCPAGVFGRANGLRSRSCSGVCPGGHYCPQGTALPIECGTPDHYCPLGAAAPTNVPDGFFSLGLSVLTRDRVVQCPPGHFCVSGLQYPCPPGIFGSTQGLTTSQCSGECPAGHYCPEATVDPIPCPAGSFGDRGGLQDVRCSGSCREGYYCPQGSISDTANPCGGPGFFCPEGSAAPIQVRAGEYVVNGDSGNAVRPVACPQGSYCDPQAPQAPRQAQLCPAGTFGDRERLATSACSGRCSPGYYCSQGSTVSTPVACGSVDLFCPRGSALPSAVTAGYYTVGALSVRNATQDPADATTRVDEVPCEPGHYCVDGVRIPCPAGVYGSTFGLTDPACSGTCAAGYYCPQASVTATAVPCGNSAVYCPPGSVVPTSASSGYCSIGGADITTRTAQRTAKPGEFAWKGECLLCPAGSFGSRTGETERQCEAKCAAGYFCPSGSASATQFECGNASVICPRGSAWPVAVDAGHYTSIDDWADLADLDADAKYRRECGPGRARADQVAVAGTNHYIDLLTGRSTVAVNYRDARFPVSPCELCPDGTFKPVAGDSPSLCAPCPSMVATSSADRRSCECYRLAGGVTWNTTATTLRFDITTQSCSAVPVDAPTSASPVWTATTASGSVTTRTQQFPCERGFYCQRGVRFPCPAGLFSDQELETRSTCAGECAPGFYCPLASVNSSAIPCGDVSVYCPKGSVVPTPVALGYYTVRITGGLSSEDDRVRDSQRQCEPGFFCRQGKRFACPAGRFGNQVGETSPLCSGSCSRGYFCPAGVTSPTANSCGGPGFECRTGAISPVAVPEGYYSVGGTNLTRFFHRECELGHYCTGGVKFQCPAGSFGAGRGLQTAQCSGKCAAGYWCPSHPFPPSTAATQRECGNSSVYCPPGTGNAPLQVRSGYFSVGAGDGSVDPDARNTTRTGQEICPRGFFCRNGIRIQCPAGTYGDVEGLTTDDCNGWCPAGFACPAGTSDYHENKCPPGTYAPRGSVACIHCPPGSQNRSTVLTTFHLLPPELQAQPCTHERACCFFG